MFIRNIELKNFRNYESLTLDFDERINLILGDNAQGKTNLVEAIYVSSFGKSFRTSSDYKLIKFGEKEAFVKVEAAREDFNTEVEITIKAKGGFQTEEKNIIPTQKAFNTQKFVRKDKKNITKTADLLSNILIVVFSPEDLKIVKDEPEKRRKFINRELCQISLSYLDNLSNYKKALLQRNTYLKESSINPDLLDIWDIQLAKYGAAIIKLREKYIEKIARFSAEIHNGITGGEEKLEIKYDPNLSIQPTVEDQEARFYEALKMSFDSDLRNRSTQVGPHRDDIAFFVNGVDMRAFGSQGQQRTCALSLKLAELSLIKEDTGENPILILDDVMSELDQKRQEYLIETLSENQLFITTTDLDSSLLAKLKDARVFHVTAGCISE
ncbi:MAG: DNA replication/repair protein RecF [Firmicutes bacterium]|nr:DNA replication/repair protein RecF [Bacillota bacterium]